MTAKGLLIAILCAALLIAGLTACGSSSPAKSQPPASAPATSWVVLVDLSGSTLSARHDYVDVLGRVLRAVRPGDSLTILSIEQSSVENSRFLFQGTFPRFSFKPGTPPDTDNPLAIKDFQAREAKRNASEKAAFDRTHDLRARLRALRTALTGRILNYSAPATDIFGALLLAGNEFSASNGPHRLVMLTDGVVVDGQANFLRQRLSRSVILRIASAQKREHRLPSLRGARVLIVGARLGGSLDFARLSDAWCLYINKAAGGHLASRFFMSRLSNRLFSAWLKAGDGG